MSYRIKTKAPSLSDFLHFPAPCINAVSTTVFEPLIRQHLRQYNLLKHIHTASKQIFQYQKIIIKQGTLTITVHKDNIDLQRNIVKITITLNSSIFKFRIST